MDGQTPVPPKKGFLLEIVFVAVILVILFGILNYFNILKLSEIFPNYLGFLPHIKQNNKPGPNPTQIPANFQYDMEYSKTILIKYVKEIIKPEFLPENLDIKQGLTFNNSVDEKLKNLFGSYIKNDNETISVTFNYIENTFLPSDFKILIHPIKTEQTTLNVALANSLISSYFINPIPIEKCDSIKTTSYCKTIKTESEGKREFGVIIGLDSSKSPPVPVSTIFTCFIPKENILYDRINSCVSP